MAPVPEQQPDIAGTNQRGDQKRSVEKLGRPSAAESVWQLHEQDHKGNPGDHAGGNETPRPILLPCAIAALALTTDYTVVLNADQDTSPGGSITLTAGGLAVGLTLTITMAMLQEQVVNLTNGGGFYPNVINAALDTLTILIQQPQAQPNRTVQVPYPDNATMELPGPAVRAGKLLMFDSAGNVQLVTLATGASSIVGSQGAAGTINAANRVFTFQAAAGATPTPLVYAARIFQSPGTDYGALVFISGTTWQITFTNAPLLGPITVLLFA